MELGGGSVGYVCSNIHGKINMWARYKPVRSPMPVWDLHKRYVQKMVGGMMQWVESNDSAAVPGYRGERLDCGIKAAATSVVNAIGGADYAWSYEPPTRFFNLAHFDGYRHNARAPFSGIVYTGESATVLAPGDSKTVEVYSGQTVQVALNPSIIPNDGSNLTLADLRIDGMTTSDIESLDDAYFGIAVFGAEACAQGDYKYFFTADEGGSRSLEWLIESGPTGSDIWVVPVLAKNRQRRRNDNGSLASLVSNMLMRVPGVPVAKVRYVTRQETTGVTLELKASGSVDAGVLTVTGSLTVKNEGSKAYVPTELTVTLLVNGVSKAQYYREYPFGNPDDTGGKIIGVPANSERGLFIDLSASGYKSGDDIELRAVMEPGRHIVARKVIMPVTPETTI